MRMQTPAILFLVMLFVVACANRPKTMEALRISGIAGQEFCLMEPAEVVAKKAERFLQTCFFERYLATGGLSFDFIGGSVTPAYIDPTLKSHSYRASMEQSAQGFRGALYWVDERPAKAISDNSGFVMTVDILIRNEPNCQTSVKPTAVKNLGRSFDEFELAVRTGQRPPDCK